MVESLPSGTVSLLFTDIQGSTLLLARLGSRYSEALANHRLVMRKAWATHGGIELGTKGDSFFVVFPAAPAAICAAAQAQRELATFPWPDGERVRVRMGIHTGSPLIHDGEYVGMDVHRAARIADAAHGGQTVVSSETTRLVDSQLPESLRLTYLGVHKLKDLAAPERLFQLEGVGLEADFPPLRTLGTVSSLPTPATALIGRENELADLAAGLSQPGMRLLTLTGPGGAGKTRLAIGLAQAVAGGFGDGVHFVPLASAATVDVMWTTIAEVLDVPPEGRAPPGLFAHVAHRSALLVLDNLEQVPGAESVVSELLTQAPRMVVIATSRRPLHLSVEHEFAVPPLALPERDDYGMISDSPAVQLFVRQARMINSRFELTETNAYDIADVCQRLDGVPLAVELAAARTKVLSPRAILARLDRALDLLVSSAQGPARQKTLRATIAWSYELLTADQQALFGSFGVFAGGADLDALTVINGTDDDADDADIFEVLTGLTDASLITVNETADGEPRFGMLQTIRAYAREQLRVSGRLPALQDCHAHHYLRIAETLSRRLPGPHYLDARASLEIEQDNLRESLNWALASTGTRSPARLELGLRLCAALDRFWFLGGYFAERRGWLERVTGAASAEQSPELARCLQALAESLRSAGDQDRAYECAAASVNMWRRLPDSSGLARALMALAALESDRKYPEIARPLFEEAIRVARLKGDKEQLRRVLGGVATLEGSELRLARSLELDTEALGIAEELQDVSGALFQRHNIACTLRQLGRVTEAADQMGELIPLSLRLNEPSDLVVLAEDYAAILSDLGEYASAARLLGAAEALQERLGISRYPIQEAEIASPIARARSALTSREWTDAYQAGRSHSIQSALTQAHARYYLRPAPDPAVAPQ